VQPEVGSVTGLGFMSGKGVARGLSVGRFSGGGIGFLFSDATNNMVEGCYVGIDPSGTNRVANTGAGISLFLGAANNVIGGTNITQRNVISGNNEGGIVIRGTNSSGNRVIGNLIGLDASGTASIASTQNGVEIIDGATANLVGGTLLGERNIISGNGASAVLIAGDGAASNIVQGNFIGLDVTGTNAVPNSGAGIGLSDGAVGNLVGGTAPGAGNIIVGSQSYGIAAASATTAFNTIQGNWIGVDATGNRAVPNGTGVAIFLGAHENLIGGATSGAGNVISGSLDAGLSLTGTNTTSNTIQGNRIGTSSDGLAAIPNQGDGILIHGSASGNAIGGTSSGAGNLISGNRTSGISMEDAYTLNNTVQGNLIGLDITGTNLLGNASVGVGLLSGSASNLIGGSVVGARNIIAGSGSFGIAIVSADTTANVIQGNWIGVDATGAKAAPNGYGVTLFSGAHDNLIGGSNAGEGNVISGNTQLGVGIDGATTANNILQGNKIGTDASGTVAVANQSDGILVRSGARQNLIGGVAAGAGNLISGNGGSGVVVNGTNTTQNLIQGNLIGTDLSGTSKLANAIVNVWIRSDAYENVVGLDKTGAGRGNRIGYGQAGVVVDGDLALGNTIRGNAMPHNGGPSIFLTSDTVEGSAPLDNDDLDPDSGPNRLQNYPVLGTVSLSNGVFSISGTFNSTPNREYFLDFYRNTSTNGSTYGDAEEYVGSLRVTTGADGNVAPFTYTVASSTDLDRFTATATDVTTGDTSELSPVAVRLLPTLFSGPYSFTATRKLRFNLDLNMGQTYRIQATTNLAAPEWMDVQTVNASSAGLREVDVPAGTNAVQEFYRVVSP
jgi:titin